MLKFTESHEWISIEGDVGTVGITTHAQKELGEIVFVELPIVGKNVRGAEETAVLESTKAASDVYAPVAGEIIEVNQDLKKSCATINLSPQDQGWLFKMKIHSRGEAESLMNSEEYHASLRGSF